MKEIDIFSVVREFTPEQEKKFDLFIRSGYYNYRKSLHNIYSVIVKNRNLLIKKNYDLIYKKIQQKLKYNLNLIYKNISLLNTLAFKFLYAESYDKKLFRREQTISEELIKMNLFPLLSKRINKLNSTIQKSDTNDEGSFIDLYNHNMNIIYENIVSAKISSNTHKLREKYTLTSILDITTYYLTQVIANYINLVCDNYSVLQRDGIKSYVVLLSNLESDDFKKLYESSNKHKRFIELYKLLFNAFKNFAKSEYYFIYKSYFIENIKYFGTSTIKYHFETLLNFCGLKWILNTEVEKFRKEYLNLIEIYAGKNYFRDENTSYFPENYFRNYIVLASVLKEFERIKLFTQNISGKLAYYYFGTQKYLDSLKCLNKIDPNLFILRYDIRNLELKIFFENNNFEQAVEASHNYLRIVNSDKMLGVRRKRKMQLFISYFRQLVTYSLKAEDLQYSAQLGILKKNIIKTDNLSEKTWLLEKIAKLEAIYSSKVSKRKIL